MLVHEETQIKLQYSFFDEQIEEYNYWAFMETSCTHLLTLVYEYKSGCT